ncbi:MAG: hypothetical protein JWM73_1395 [Solirubrobacterales bacterium]|nr:hypothetical protein [Solirubrobacterales bacterium]
MGWTQRPPALASFPPPMDNDVVKRLAWSAMLAGVGAVASIITTRLAAMIYVRVFGEDPPE